MAIDVQAQRAEGVAPLSPNATRGSRGTGNDAGSAPYLPTSSMDEQLTAPGGHVNRGVEPNTALSGPGNTADPVIDIVVAGEGPMASEPFSTPDTSAHMSTDLSHSDWDDGPWNAPDKSGPNERAIDFSQLSTFASVGEQPQGECDGA